MSKTKPVAKLKPEKIDLPLVDSVEDLDEDDLTPEETDALAALADMEGGADAKWQVHRIGPTNDPNKPTGFCDELTSAEISLKEIRARFGKGKYRVKGFRSNGSYLKHLTVTIASDPPKEATPAAQSNNDFFAILAKRDADAQAKRDSMMALVIPGALAALPAILAALRPQQTDPIVMISALKGLQPDPPKAPDMLPLIGTLIEAARDGKGGDTNWMDLVKGAIEQLPGVIAHMKNVTPPAAPQRVHVTPQPTAQIVAPAPIPETVLEGEDMNLVRMMRLQAWAKETLAMLVGKAASSKDPGLYADWVMDNVPDGVDAREFVKYLNEPNWWEILQQFDASVAPYHGWFAQFKDFLTDAAADVYGEAVDEVPTDDALLTGEDDVT